MAGTNAATSPLSYNPHPRLAGPMSSESARVVEAFFFACRSERKRGARVDQSSTLFLAMRDRAIREQRARELEQAADRLAWEGLWG